MARKKQSLDEQIKQWQEEVWSLAEFCDSEQLKIKDQIYEQGLVYMETEILRKLFDDDSDEVKKDYLLLLNEMRKFYKKVTPAQGMVI